jgi:hypothetical protein
MQKKKYPRTRIAKVNGAWCVFRIPNRSEDAYLSNYLVTRPGIMVSEHHYWFDARNAVFPVEFSQTI